MKKQKEPAKPLIHSSEPARESGITGRTVIADHRPGSEALSQLRATMQSGYTRPILPQRVPPGGEQQCDYPAGYSCQQNGAVQHSRGAIIQRTGNEDEEKKKKLREELEVKLRILKYYEGRIQELEEEIRNLQAEKNDWAGRNAKPSRKKGAPKVNKATVGPIPKSNKELYKTGIKQREGVIEEKERELITCIARLETVKKRISSIKVELEFNENTDFMFMSLFNKKYEEKNNQNDGWS